MRIKIKVIANSRQEKIEEMNGLFKVHLRAPPVKGKANEALIRLLAEKFGTSKSNVRILKGQTSNIKEIEIDRD